MQTRKSIWETNSSSTHSVVIGEGADFVKPEIKDDVIKISAGEYGWEECTYKAWDDRASYAFTYAKNYGKESDIENLKRIIEEFTGKKVEFCNVSGETKRKGFDSMMNNLKEQGVIPKSQKIEMDEVKDDDFGYIDHQSMDEAEKIFENEESIKKFIFGSDSYFTTDNDNH